MRPSVVISSTFPGIARHIATFLYRSEATVKCDLDHPGVRLGANGTFWGQARCRSPQTALQCRRCARSISSEMRPVYHTPLPPPHSFCKQISSFHPVARCVGAQIFEKPYLCPQISESKGLMNVLYFSIPESGNHDSRNDCAPMWGNDLQKQGARERGSKGARNQRFRTGAERLRDGRKLDYGWGAPLG